MPYNTSSPNSLNGPCRFEDLDCWFLGELKQISSKKEKQVLRVVGANLNSFVRWANKAILLWPGCARVPEEGETQKYFRYPDHLRALIRAAGVPLDTRANGPAIASFLLAGGERPKRFGSSNAWSIHHLYSGKFPYCAIDVTTHAAKNGKHFTQSAGRIAAHPVADALVDEFPFFTWLLRANAYHRFGYDPDQVFCSETDGLGFAPGRQCEVIRPLGGH